MARNWPRLDLDWLPLGLMLGLLGLSMAMLSGLAVPTTAMSYAARQAIWVVLGALLLVAVVVVDYHDLARYAGLFAGVCVLLLVAVLLVGVRVEGSQRWLDLGVVRFEPSEVMKLSLVLLWARELARRASGTGLRVRALWLPGLWGVVAMGLLLQQPQLGAVLSLGWVFILMVLVTGVNSRALNLGLICLPLAFPFLWHLFWGSLKTYQRERLLAFLDPTVDPLGSGYHVIQSKIAIGSGGLFGQGWLGGTQGQLRFLPETHTDFIFPAIVETWGFVGALVVLTLYAALLLWGVQTARNAKDLLGALIATGVVALLSFHVVVNIGMTMGLMPVVGVPLPLLSYGGTMTVTTMAAIGLLLNVRLRRLMLFY